jgi:hypothetical protein
MNPLQTPDLEALKYPIGKFVMPDKFDASDVEEWVGILQGFPARLAQAVTSLTPTALDFRYRPGGWMVKQVVHHLADSHMNAFIRFKLALTESQPTIKPYDEAKMAELSDSLNSPPEASIMLLTGLHQRWTELLNSLHLEDFNKTYFHPEYQKTFPLSYVLGLYAWHSNHHLAHIRQALSYRNDF